MSKNMKGQVAKYVATGGLFGVLGGVIGGTLGYRGYSLQDVDRMTDILIPFFAVARFFVHKYWVFSNRDSDWVRQPAKYFTIVLGTWLAYVSIKNGLAFVGVPYWTAWGIGLGMAVIVRFIFLRRLFNL